MPRRRFFSFLSVCFLYSLPVFARDSADLQELFSPYNAQTFHQIAYQMYNAPDANESEFKQAFLFLAAAASLDEKAEYIPPGIIEVKSRFSEEDNFNSVYWSLIRYVDESADLEVAKLAVRYLLERLNSREEREELLQGLLQKLAGKNSVLTSELATQLGLLKAEQTDFATAQSYLMRAYNSYNYNNLAFAKIEEITPESVTPAFRIRHLRLMMGTNPLDMKASLTFAQYAQTLQLYETAAEAYQYCADLSSYLYPSEPLDPTIYLPWAISNYNTQRNQYKCLQIAKRIRESGRSDILLAGIAAKAAEKIGDMKKANQLLKDTEQRAKQLLSGNATSQQVSAELLGWFYSFVHPDADKALTWANKAYAAEPNSPSATAIFAYALIMYQQTELAKPLIADLHKNNQIAAVAMALIQLSEQQSHSAIETLKSAISMDAGSLVAEKARALLLENGSQYVSSTDPNIVLQALRGNFGGDIVPEFVGPDNIISAKLAVNRTELSYGGELSGGLVIKNRSSNSIVIGDEALFKGNIRVDADLRGDINIQIPKLILRRVRPSLVIKPDESAYIPLQLMTGRLKQVLFSHPQASVEIEFTAYLDPVTSADGKVGNTISGIKPPRQLVRRPGVKLTIKYLQNRLNSLSKGRQGQKVKSAQLFAGLLAEHLDVTERKMPYKIVSQNPAIYKSALVRSLTDKNWTVKVQTMATILPLPLDYELTSAISTNLNDSKWPVRMMSLFLLAKSQGPGFKRVLDWTTKYDSDKIVRDMAVALGGTEPEVQPAQTETGPASSNKKIAEPDIQLSSS